MRARSTLFTLFGDVVRPAGGEAWLTTLTACMDALGFTPEATRTALHRMSLEGWVEPRRKGRYALYRLTPKGVDRLEEAAARIYRLRGADWDGRWRLLVCPSASRDVALGRALRWMGFGRLSADVWVSPHPHGDRIEALLAEHGLAHRSHRFLTESRPGPAEAGRDGEDGRLTSDDDIVARAWDLSELRDAHLEFLARWQDVEPPTEPRAAFTTRLRLIHHWRKFLFLDPGLPVSLLPPDSKGEAAAECFRTLYEAVSEPSWAFYDALAAAAPGRPPDTPLPSSRRPDASPFAQGLAALDTRGRVPATPARTS